MNVTPGAVFIHSLPVLPTPWVWGVVHIASLSLMIYIYELRRSHRTALVNMGKSVIVWPGFWKVPVNTAVVMCRPSSFIALILTHKEFVPL